MTRALTREQGRIRTHFCPVGTADECDLPHRQRQVPDNPESGKFRPSRHAFVRANPYLSEKVDDAWSRRLCAHKFVIEIGPLRAPIAAADLYNRFAVMRNCWNGNPGCAARPWALLSNRS